MKKLPELDARAAFVDVGSEQMHVSVAGDRPQVFGTVSSQLHALRDWLLEQGVRSVAMEATGVYWLGLYAVLEAAGLEVLMVNGRQTRNVPGRKSDMADCQWGAALHAHGLLRAGFVPKAEIRRLQDYMRLRADHISLAASHVQHMQQALERMNVKLHDVISSLTGVGGLALVRAIVAGERAPERLLALCDVQIQRHKGERVKESLRGIYSEEHLFALRQALASWQHYQSQIAECDARVEALLRELNQHEPPPDLPENGKAHPGAGVNAPQIGQLREMLAQLCAGQDLTRLPGHSEYSVLQLVSEVGTDLSKWANEKRFGAWLGLAPGTHQSGKRKSAFKRKAKRNRAGRLFCVMARSLGRSKHFALGAFYRRLAARRGALVANIALARKLAILYWRVMVKGLHYVEHGVAHYEMQLLQSKQRALRRLAKELGQQLVPIAHTT